MSALAEMNNDWTKQITYYRTDENRQLSLSTCREVNLTTTTQWTLSFKDLINFFNLPPVQTIHKTGPGFLIGPCKSPRCNANLPFAHVAVIDADSSVLPSGLVETGAPPPEAVHAVLKEWDLSHVIYTTYSHGTGKGNRYRIVFPIDLNNDSELVSFVTWIVANLNHANIPLALTRESAVWAQQWALPRVVGDCAPYKCYSHIGEIPDARFLAYEQGRINSDGSPNKPPPLPSSSRQDPPPGGRNSLIGMFNIYYPVERFLSEHGYTFHNQQIYHEPGREPKIIGRWKKPGSHSQPGVMVFTEGHMTKVYSHHTTDPLCNGYANDSFQTFCLLNDLPELEGLQAAVVMVQAAVCSEMNNSFPSVLEGGSKFKIGNRGIDDLGAEFYSFMDVASFNYSQMNKGGIPYISRGEDGAQIIGFQERAKFWLNSEDRTMYNGLVYDPCDILGEHTRTVWRKDRLPYFNTFNGWNVTPYPGDWPLLEWHLKNSICGGIEEEYQYLLNWISHLVQKPTEKPGVALVLRGKKGWGKSKPFSIFAKSLGANAIILGNNSLLTGRFNGHMHSKLLALVEESFWAAHHQQEGVLKHLITDDWTTYEGKGRDAVQGSSYIRVIMITNEAWAAPATGDERRFFIPTLTDSSLRRDEEKGKKGGFFPQLFHEMQNGGLEAFLYDMAKRKVSHSDIVNVPETAGLKAQRAYSVQGVTAWLLTCLINGEIETDTGTIHWGNNGCIISEQQLRKSVQESLSKFDRERNIDYRINKALFEILGSLMRFSGKNRVFSSLQECRKAFVKYTKVDDNLFNRPGETEEYVSNVIPISRL